MSPNGKKLYATLNGEGNIAKIDVAEKRGVDKVCTGSEPRSMAMAPDGKSLYVVNDGSNKMGKVRTSDMKVIQAVNTTPRPSASPTTRRPRASWCAATPTASWCSTTAEPPHASRGPDQHDVGAPAREDPALHYAGDRVELELETLRV